MKMSLVELKNVIDQDVHSTRVSSRLYGTAEDDKEENAEEDKEKNARSSVTTSRRVIEWTRMSRCYSVRSGNGSVG